MVASLQAVTITSIDPVCHFLGLLYELQGRNQSVLDSLSEVVRSSAPQSVALVQRFSDPVYHRSNFTLGGRPGAVEQTAMRLIRAALKA